MLRRTFFSILILLGLFLISYYIFLYTKEIKKKEWEKLIQNQAAIIADKMTPDELAGQVVHISLPEKNLDRIAKKEISNIKPGGIILFGKNLGTASDIKQFTSELQKLAHSLNIPSLIISTDQESGRVIRVTDGVTQFPGAMALGQTNNETTALQVGFYTSYELRQLGINVFFAPVMDINNNPDNPVINTRSFGSDMETVSRIAVAFEEGARLGGSVPVIKHFPGHGDTNTDSHLGLPIIKKKLPELEKFELKPFHKSIENGALALMTAHIVYPEIDPYFPSTLSKVILTDLLRKKFSYNGIIFTDAMEMHAISKNYKKDRPAVLALLAGADIILFTSWGKEPAIGKKEILDAYSRGEFHTQGKDLLKEAVIRQLALKIRSGIITLPILKEYYDSRLEEKSTAIQKFTQSVKELNRKVSLDSIRGYKKEFHKLEKDKKITFNLHHPSLIHEAKKMGLINSQDVTTPYITDSFDAKDLKRIDAIRKKFPERQIIILHYGNPYLPFKEDKKTDILFSFSPTNESMKSLLQSVFRNDKTKTIPKANLIFH